MDMVDRRKWSKWDARIRWVTTILALVFLVLAYRSAHSAQKGTKHLVVRVASNERAGTQQNVSARYADCLAGDQLRSALTKQVRESAKTDPLLFKLLPSLNTPEVRKLVASSRRDQLKAYRPRGTKGCQKYALKSVPPLSRHEFRTP